MKLRTSKSRVRFFRDTKTEETLIEKLHIGDRGLNEISIHFASQSGGWVKASRFLRSGL